MQVLKPQFTDSLIVIPVNFSDKYTCTTEKNILTLHIYKIEYWQCQFQVLYLKFLAYMFNGADFEICKNKFV